MNRANLLTVKEVARYLKVHEITIYRLLKQGKIPALRIGGQWRFDIDSIRSSPYVKNGAPSPSSAAKKGRRKHIPKSLWRYFWDVAPEKLYADKNSDFILERLLEYGDTDAVKWMGENFNKDEIKNIVLKSRQLSPRSLNYWHLVLNLKRPYNA